MSLFRRRKPSPAIPSTGYTDDDEVLRRIASLSPLSKARSWDHYLYCRTESGAREVARQIEAAGWRIHRIDHAANGSGWEATI